MSRISFPAGLLTASFLLCLLLVALLMRLVNLDAYTGKFDEGIRAEQLLLMSDGFRPVRDIFAAQGPLSLDIFFGPYLAFGQTLAAARAAVVIYSLLGIVALFWVGSLMAGRLGGGLVAILLVLSPLYLKNSRLALVEVPAMVPASLALGAGLLFQATGRTRWLLLSASIFAIGLLIKPMVVAVAGPLGLALLLRPKRRWSDLMLFGVTAAGLVLAVVALYGAEQVWQQVVTYRTTARQSSGWSLNENWSTMVEELRDEQLSIYALALIGGLGLAVTRPRWGLPLLAWPLASFCLLLVYSPLQFKHMAILIPPLALVVGTAAATACYEIQAARGREWLFKVLPALGLASWYISSLPAVLRQDWLVMSAATEMRVEAYQDESRVVPQLSSPEDFIIVDDPILAFNSRRKVPPGLVDPSSYRIRSGALSGAEAVASAEQYNVKLMALTSDGLRGLRRFAEHVDAHYRAIKIYERQNAKDRALYLRQDADFAAARALLARDVESSIWAEFGGDLRLLGYTLARDEARPGTTIELTLHWEALRPMLADYHVITHLRGPGGQPDFQSERGLGGGGPGTTSWQPGSWVFRSQVLSIPARTPPGEYLLSVALYDSKNRIFPPLTVGDGVGSTELSLSRVRVR